MNFEQSIKSGDSQPDTGSHQSVWSDAARDAYSVKLTAAAYRQTPEPFDLDPGEIFKSLSGSGPFKSNFGMGPPDYSRGRVFPHIPPSEDDEIPDE